VIFASDVHINDYDNLIDNLIIF